MDFCVIWEKIFVMCSYMYLSLLLSYCNWLTLFVCLFVVFGPTAEFFTYMTSLYNRWKAAILTYARHSWLIEQWGFLSVQHLLWHGASVNNGHLRGPVTLTPIVERLAVKQSLPVLWLSSVAAGIQTPHLPLACGANSQPTAPRSTLFVDMS